MYKTVTCLAEKEVLLCQSKYVHNTNWIYAADDSMSTQCLNKHESLSVHLTATHSKLYPSI